MRRTLLLYSIFTFLFAVSSIKAAAGEPDRDSLLFEAAKCERIAFDAANPREANAALLQKAELYKQAGCYKEAMETLSRVRMFLVRPEERKAVTTQKALCSFLAEDYDSAMSFLTEAGIEFDYTEPKLKNEWAAMLLTLLIEPGYIYVGAPGEGAVSTLLNAASVAWLVTQVASGLYVTGIAGGCLALSETYLGAQERVASLMGKRNSETLRSAKREAVAAALLGVL